VKAGVPAWRGACRAGVPGVPACRACHDGVPGVPCRRAGVSPGRAVPCLESVPARFRGVPGVPESVPARPVQYMYVSYPITPHTVGKSESKSVSYNALWRYGIKP
jgi:hypothetical protein